MGKEIWYLEYLTNLSFVYLLSDNYYFAGELTHLAAFGKHVIYLNSYEAVMEVFQKRSSKYAERPRFVMVAEV